MRDFHAKCVRITPRNRQTDSECSIFGRKRIWYTQCSEPSMNSAQYLKINRIALIITIIAGFAVGALNGFKVREKIRQLQSSLQQQTAARQTAETGLARAKGELGTTLAALAQTKITLQTVTQEKESAIANASAQTKRAELLVKDLADSHAARDHARAEL